METVDNSALLNYNRHIHKLAIGAREAEVRVRIRNSLIRRVEKTAESEKSRDGKAEAKRGRGRRGEPYFATVVRAADPFGGQRRSGGKGGYAYLSESGDSGA